MIRRALRVLLEALYVTEYIGQEDCPLMRRWTLVKFFGLGKIMVHHFPPNVSDRDPHDHPSPFLTLILKGGYFNTEWVKVDLPGQEWMEEIEWLGRGELRYRSADHMHITETNDRGAWTLVLMGPKVRPWGFLKDGKWMAWVPYVEKFGGVLRCEEGVSHTFEPGEFPAYRHYKGTPPA